METGTTQPRGTGRGGNSGGQRGTSKVEERSTRTRRAGRKSRLITTIVAISAFLGAASPAAGDDLVSNMGLPDLPLGSNSRFENFDFAQSFSTGANVSGYQLESISLYFADPSDHATDPVYVSLHQDDGNGRPGAQVTELTKNGINYAGPVRGVNKYNVWKARCYPQPPHGGGCLNDPSSVHIAPNTTYWVYVWAGNSDTGAAISYGLGTSETGATGWSITNDALLKTEGSGYSNFTRVAAPLRIKVEGTTNPEVLVSINDVTVTEGVELTADFVVSLSRATSGVVTVDFETLQTTADPASDYYEDDGTLTFQPGETQKTVSIEIQDDALAESDETFDFVLSNLKGATLADSTGTATIVNADPLTVSVGNATATEGVDETIDFTVSLNRATNRRLKVNMLFSSGCTTSLLDERQAAFAARRSQKSSKRPLRMQQRRAMMALAPVTVQRMPARLSRAPICLHPASTTPDETHRPLARNCG